MTKVVRFALPEREHQGPGVILRQLEVPLKLRLGAGIAAPVLLMGSY